MAGANQTIGHAGAVSFDLAFSAVLLEIGVKLLQIALRQLVQRYLTDRGNDVQIDAVFVSCSLLRTVSGNDEVAS